MAPNGQIGGRKGRREGGREGKEGRRDTGLDLDTNKYP